jgi:hypothetical protein
LTNRYALTTYLFPARATFFSKSVRRVGKALFAPCLAENAVIDTAPLHGFGLATPDDFAITTGNNMLRVRDRSGSACGQ